MNLSELVQIKFSKIVQTISYTMIVMRGAGKNFAIYTEPGVGKILQLFLSEVATPRPLTHDLFDQIFEGLDLRVKQVVLNDYQDTVFYARLFLEQDLPDLRHIIEIDGRPSDCLIMALINNAPIYCTRDVLDKTIAVDDTEGDSSVDEE